VYNGRSCSVCEGKQRRTGQRARTIRPPRSSSWERVSISPVSRSQSPSGAASHTPSVVSSGPPDYTPLGSSATPIAPPPGSVILGQPHPEQAEHHRTPSVVPSGAPTQASSTISTIVPGPTSAPSDGSHRATSPARTVWTDATEAASPTRTEWTDGTDSPA
jgi:hypothetical protein